MRFRYGDPESDFDYLDRKQAEYEARLPVCEKCGETINDDEFFEINGEILCEECMRDRYARRTEDLVNAYE